MGSRPSYPVSVRQVAVLLHASFRPRLAATPLRFANTSPPSGCVGDLHPQVVEHARHTTNRCAEMPEATVHPASATPCPLVALYPARDSGCTMSGAQSHPGPGARLEWLGNVPTGPRSGAPT